MVYAIHTVARRSSCWIASTGSGIKGSLYRFGVFLNCSSRLSMSRPALDASIHAANGMPL